MRRWKQQWGIYNDFLEQGLSMEPAETVTKIDWLFTTVITETLKGLPYKVSEIILSFDSKAEVV
jgi:hypothetical protein